MLGFGNTPRPSSVALRHSADECASALPEIILEAERAVQSVLSGEHRQRKPGSGERFWQFRDYNPSDRLQDIDWRQTGKADQVFVREKERQNAQNAVFWCQDGLRMEFSSAKFLPTKRWAAKILTLALGILATRAHEKIMLLGSDTRPGRTEKTIQLFGESLLGSQNTDLTDVLKHNIPGKSFCFLIGDFLDPVIDIDKSLSHAAGICDHGCVIQILDPAEIILPYTGRVLFVDPASQERQSIDNVGEIRKHYQERVQSHRDALRRLCVHHGWHLASHVTNEDIAQTLSDIWMAIAPDVLSRNGG